MWVWFVIAIVVLLVFVGWDLIDTNKVNSNRYVADWEVVFVSVLNNYGMIVEKINYKSFGYNSLGLSEAPSRGFLESLKKSNALKEIDVIKISRESDKLFLMSLSYYCALYLFCATKILLKESQFSNSVRHKLSKEFIEGFTDGANDYFMNESVDFKSFKKFFSTSFDLFSKYLTEGHIDKISALFMLGLKSQYQIELDDAGVYAFDLLIDPGSEVEAISKFFKVSLGTKF